MRRQKAAWIALAYLLWSILLTLPLVFRMLDGLPQDLGDPLLNTWILAWETRALVEQPRALFDAPIFYPHTGTLAYSEPLLGILPFAFPFMLATGIPALGYNVAFVFSFWIAALGMRHLVRAGGGRERAAFVAGLLFAAAPYRFAHLMHMQLLYMGWIPLAMAALIRYGRRPGWRRAGDLALAVLLMSLSSWHLAVFGMVALGVLTLFLTRAGGITPQSWLGLGGVGGVCGLGLAAIAVPYLRIAPELAQVRTLSLAQEFAAWPVDLLAAPPVLRIVGPLTAPFRIPGHTTHEVQLYVGLVTAIAAAFGVRWKRSPTQSALRWTALALIGIGGLMAMGHDWNIGAVRIPGLYALVAWIPGLTLIRATARWFILALIGFSVLAGLGLDRLSRNRRWGLAVLGLGLGALEGWAVPIPIAPLPRPTDLPAVYHWLARQPGSFAVLELPVFLPLDADETMRMYAALVHRKPLVIAYSGYIPPDIRELRERLRTFPQPEALDEIVRLSAIGVRYVLVDRSHHRDFPLPGLCQVSRNPYFMYVGFMDPYDVFEVRSAPEAEPAETQPVQATFGDVAVLKAYRVHQIAPDRVEVWLIWEAGPRPHGSYSITVQVLDENGEKLAQQDGPPRNGSYLFDCWRPGERIVDHRVLQGAAEDLLRASRLGVAIYTWPALERVPVRSAYPAREEMLILPISSVAGP